MKKCLTCSDRAAEHDRSVCCRACFQSQGRRHNVACAMRQVSLNAPGARCYTKEAENE